MTPALAAALARAEAADAAGAAPGIVPRHPASRSVFRTRPVAQGVSRSLERGERGTR